MNFHFAVPKTLKGVYTKDVTNISIDGLSTMSNKVYPISQGNLNNLEFVSKSYSDKEVYYASNKSIQDSEWDTIEKYLINSPYIKSIHLSGISINKYGLEKLGLIIRMNNRIKSLNLEWNFLNELVDEFEDFSDSICQSNVSYLSLNNNKLNSSHKKAILSLVQSNKLSFLSLKWNEIGNDIVKNIIDIIDSKTKLIEINLAGNKISTDLLIELEYIIKKKDKEKSNKISSEKILKSSHDRGFTSNRSTKKDFYNKTRSFSPLYHFRSGSNVNENNEDNYIQFNNIRIDDEKRNIVYTNDALSEEYKHRYDGQLVNNLSLERKITELEMELKNSKIKYNELNQKFNEELEIEKSLKGILENELSKHKDIILEKELDFNKNISEKDIRIRELLLQSEEFKNELNSSNERLQNTINSNNDQIKEIKNHYQELLKISNSNLDELKKENVSIRKEMEDNINLISKELEKKLNQEEINNSKLIFENNRLSKDNTILRKEINELKLFHSSEIKDRERSIIEEESKKMMLISKDFETKATMLKSNMEDIKRRNLNLSEENDKLKNEVNLLTNQLEEISHQFQTEKEKLNDEISKTNKKYNLTLAKLETQEDLYKVSIKFY